MMRNENVDVDTVDETPVAAVDFLEPDRGVLRILSTVFAVFLFTLIAVGGLWKVTGGNFMVMTTPSMSPGYPVGSLVLTRPASSETIEVGTVISFYPPGDPNTTYTHRVAKVTAAGYETRGDIEKASDPWVIPKANVAGVVVYEVPGAGWLLKMLPWIVLGFLIAIAAAAWVPWRWGITVPLLVIAVIITVPLLILKPFVNGQVVYTDNDVKAKTMTARVVNTGLMPLTLKLGSSTETVVPGGAWVDMKSAVDEKPNGETSIVPLTGYPTPGLIGWILLIGFCLSPFMVSLLLSYEENYRYKRGHFAGVPEPEDGGTLEKGK